MSQNSSQNKKISRNKKWSKKTKKALPSEALVIQWLNNTKNFPSKEFFLALQRKMKIDHLVDGHTKTSVTADNLLYRGTDTALAEKNRTAVLIEIKTALPLSQDKEITNFVASNKDVISSMEKLSNSKLEKIFNKKFVLKVKTTTPKSEKWVDKDIRPFLIKDKKEKKKKK